MLRRFLALGSTALALTGFTIAPALAQEQLAIKGGTILPIVGAPIENGVVLIEDGRIKAVGDKDLSIPVGAKVLDATGKIVMPGFVEPYTSSGMSQPNEVNPNVPFVSVLDSIDPSLDYFEDARRNGVTTAAIGPGPNTMIGGQAAIVKTAGRYSDDMVLKRHASLKLSLRPAGGRSRMSHLARLRQELVETKEYMDELDKKAEEQRLARASATKDDDAGGNGEDDDATSVQEPDDEADEDTPEEADESVDPELQREAMVRLLKGELPAFLYCDSAMDVPQALKLIDEYDLDAVLILGRSTYKAIDRVAASKLPVILDSTLVFWETDPRTGEDQQIILPKLYQDAGIPMTFQADSSSSTLGRNYLWYQAATAVKYGTPVEDALEALTIRPAKILGVEEFVGSIEPGKDADLIILTGDPLQADTWVETTIVNGQIVYERDQDQKLQNLLQPRTANTP